MTDARLRGEWLGKMAFDDLSDTAWRVFTGALMWCAEQGTDGEIPSRYLKSLHPDGEKTAANSELLTAGIWKKTPHGFKLIDWDGALGQNTAAQVEVYKENGRKRQRAYRERERLKLEGALLGKKKQRHRPGSDTGDSTGDVTRHVGEGEGEGSGDGSELKSGWPVVEIPQAPGWVETGPGEWAEVPA